MLGVPAFELDLFGRVRSLRNAALEDYFAIEENRTAAQLLLVSEVANAWLTLIADRELLRLADGHARQPAQVLRPHQAALRPGRVRAKSNCTAPRVLWREAEVDIAQQTRRVAHGSQRARLADGRAAAARDRQRRRTRHRSADALRRNCPRACRRNCWCGARTCAPPNMRCKAANANIGAARAAFFPSIELTGFYGNASDDLSALFQAGHTSWSFVPQVRLPIFSGGANKAGLDLANVRKRIEIARYEQSIQIAFREVADALVARSTLEDQLRAQEALTRAAEVELPARRHALSRRRRQLPRRH